MSRYPELGGSFSTVHENLARLDRRMEALLECQLAHWSEWAEAMEGEERDALLQLLDNLHPDREIPLSADIPAENQAFLHSFYRHISTPQRLALLRAVLERRGQDFFRDLAAEPFEISEKGADKIAYVKNTFSDNAYLQFSAELNHPRAANFDSFSDVCEEVYNGICEYGILPILHERDGKLFRFYSLLAKYELRIVCACDVPCIEQGGVTVTRYALVRKSLPVVREDEITHIELLLPADGGEICDLFQAAQLCALTPARMDTRPSDDSDVEDMTHQITLTCRQGELALFLAFLAICLPDCTVLGLYHVLEM